MKRSIACVAVTALIMFGLSSIWAQEYAPGRVIVKLEPQAAERLLTDGTTGSPAFDRYLNELNPREMRRLVPNRRSEQNVQLRRRFGVAGLVFITYEADAEPNRVARDLQALPGVVYAHPDHYATLHAVPDDPFYSYQYAMPLMRMPDAWDQEQGAGEVIIAISDTGTDWDHPDLADNIWINDAEDLNGNGVFDNYSFVLGGDLDSLDADGNGYIDDVIGWDFVTAENVAEGEDGFPPDPDPMDFDGHGTNTAGIAGAVTDNTFMIAGTAWSCAIMPLKTFYGTPAGNATAVASDIIESFYYAADNGVSVLSMSFRSGDSEGLQDAAAYAHAAGVFLVSSAGNEYSENAPAPAGYAEVLAVAATQQQDLKASFSNYGAWVGISAPGVDIWTTDFDDTHMSDFGGTSASCPYVAGVAGLLLSDNPGMTNTDVYYQLVGTADDIDWVNPDYRGKLGCGRLNGYRALTEEPHPALRLVGIDVDDEQQGNSDSLLGPGETVSLTFAVRNYWQTALSVTGNLSTEDPNLTVDSTTPIPFGTIELDSTVISQGCATVTVAADAEIGYLVEFTLKLETESGHTEYLVFHIPMATEVFADIAGSVGLSSAGSSITAVLADFDSDGDIDLYRAAWGADGDLYRNDIDSLVNVTDSWGLPPPGNGQAAAWGDFDNDGDPDLAHGTSDGIALFRNDGDGIGFTDVTAISGLSVADARDFAPVWADYDNDGWPDLFVAHQREENRLFKNNGDETFTDVSIAAGINSEAASYSASWADFDRDGDLDLFVANYGSATVGQINEFFVNNGDGTFTEASWELGLSIGDETFVSTGGAWGDYDADGWLDLYVTNKGTSGHPNRLFRNIRGKGFVRQIDAGVEDARSSSGAAWFDFDSDGLLDLFVANRQRNSLFRNLGDGIFGDASESATITDMGLVVAASDFDMDGDEDLYVGRTGGDILLSNLNNPSSALHLGLVGTGGSWGSSVDASHARVTLTGDQTVLTRIVGEMSGMGQASPLLTFMEPMAGSGSTLRVEWPRGTMQEIDAPGMGELTITEERPSIDGAIRAVVLPFEDTHGEAFARPQISVQDNGITPQEYAIRLDVADEMGDSIASVEVMQPAGASGIVELPLVAAPPPGEIYAFQFSVISSGDEAAWNDQITMSVVGGEIVEDFERPPVSWDLSEEWRWTRSGSVYEASSGQGLLLLQPGNAMESQAVSPLFEAQANGVWRLGFEAMYDLVEDTLHVTVSNATEVLGSTVLSGSEQAYSLHTIEFNASTADYLELEWRCTRSDTNAQAGFFALDDVAVSLVLPSDPAEELPARLIVEGPWPNPSRGELSWRLTVPYAGDAQVETYDLAGRLAQADGLGRVEAGQQMVTLSSNGLAPGVYVAKFHLGGSSCTRIFVRLE